MKQLLLVPALLLAACGDNLDLNDDQAVNGAQVDAGAPSAETTDNPLFAFFVQSPGDCADHSVLLEGHYGYADGTPVQSPICRYEFEDGTSMDTCFGLHSFPTSQVVSFTVEDPATGAVGQGQDTVVGPESFELTLDVTGYYFENGPALAWSAETRYGDTAGVGRVNVDFDPIQDVIIPDPQIYTNPFGVVSVTKPGTYTVTVYAWLDFGEQGGCSATAQQTVEVPCSSDGHSP